MGNWTVDRRNLLLGAGAAGLATVPGLSAHAAAPTPVWRLSARAPGKPLVHFWSKCVGAGRANEGLRAGWLEQLEQVRQSCGFEMCRFHGLFHDDMFVVRRQDGTIRYNWQYVDELFDRMLAIGVRPFVELGFMPTPLASTAKTQFWWKGNISPPARMDEWRDLVTALARHLIERYGMEAVRTWYFEVWNEPNLAAFWDGTRSQYFELYKVSALALKAVDPQLRVGGPSTSNFVGDARFEGDVEDKSVHLTNKVADLDRLPWKGVWIEAFLTYCAAEKLPVDFISTHPYPTDFALNPDTGRNRGRTRSRNATAVDLKWLKATVRKSAYPDAEIHLTEWSSSPSSRDHTHDYLQAAAFIITANLDSVGLAQSLSYWVFSDIFEEQGGGNEAFHGGFGLINMQGIVKPAFHAYRMLHALGDELLHWHDGIAVTRHARTGKLTILIAHFPDSVTTALSFGGRDQAEAMLDQGTPKAFALDLLDLPARAGFSVQTLDRNHGNAVAAWQAMGSPGSPDPAQIKALRQAALDLGRDALTADASGRLAWRATLAPWTCMLISQD